MELFVKKTNKQNSLTQIKHNSLMFHSPGMGKMHPFEFLKKNNINT